MRAHMKFRMVSITTVIILEYSPNHTFCIDMYRKIKSMQHGLAVLQKEKS